MEMVYYFIIREKIGHFEYFSKITLTGYTYFRTSTPEADPAPLVSLDSVVLYDGKRRAVHNAQINPLIAVVGYGIVYYQFRATVFTHDPDMVIVRNDVVGHRRRGTWIALQTIPVVHYGVALNESAVVAPAADAGVVVSQELVRGDGGSGMIGYEKAVVIAGNDILVDRGSGIFQYNAGAAVARYNI